MINLIMINLTMINLINYEIIIINETIENDF